MRKLPSGTSILSNLSVSITGKKSISSYLDTSARSGEIEFNLMLPKGNVGVNTALVSSWKHLCQQRPLRSLIPTVLCFPEDTVNHLTLCSCAASAAGILSLSYHMEKSFKINLKASR